SRNAVAARPSGLAEHDAAADERPRLAPLPAESEGGGAHAARPGRVVPMTAGAAATLPRFVEDVRGRSGADPAPLGAPPLPSERRSPDGAEIVRAALTRAARTISALPSPSPRTRSGTTASCASCAPGGT
ncbi:hypothetical protein ACWDWU_34115, partial [Streptomyces sp. NPDC003442]